MDFASKLALHIDFLGKVCYNERIRCFRPSNLKLTIISKGVITLDQRPNRAHPSEMTTLGEFLVFIFIDVPIFVLKLGLLLSAALLLLLWLDMHCYPQADHGDNFREFVANVRYEDYEVSANFLISGEKISENTDNLPRSVRFAWSAAYLTQIIGLGDSIHAHNHPNGKPFSVQDLRITVGSRPTTDVVVGRDFIYVLEAPDGWPSQEELESFLHEVTMQESSKSANLTYSPVTGWVEIFLYPHLIEQLTERFGLVYTVTPVEEFLN